jgi:hypothetical protein
MAAMLTCAIFVQFLLRTMLRPASPPMRRATIRPEGREGPQLGLLLREPTVHLGDDDTWFRNMVIDNASMKGYMSS